jgi:hypothetical protein
VRAPRARYLVVAGSLVDQRGADRPPWSTLLGDALVTAASAAGRPGPAAPALLPDVTVRVCPRINHVALAHRPEVHAEIAGWWDGHG